MNNGGDNGGHSGGDSDEGNGGRHDERSDEGRIAFARITLRAVIALIVIGAGAASIPYWGGSDFPVTSLVIYVAGMVFVTMPLCVYYESLLKSHDEQAEHARHAQDAGFQNPLPKVA